MKDKIQKAEEYILKNKTNINKTYLPKMHFSARIGWINDPNGFSYDGSQFHLYYQYYPYDSKWGPMHWGHAITKDLLTWEHQGIALAPSQNYDQSGVFSGTAIIENGITKLYYTGHCDINGKVEQCQCLATSSDGINFEKYLNNPILNKSNMPKDSVFEDFRDPKVIKHNNKYLMLVASRTVDYVGQILIYSALDGVNFSYVNRIVLDRKYGDIVECPDLLKIDNKDVLIFSTQKAIISETIQNAFSVFAFVGQFNDKTSTFDKESEQTLDFGFDFYAPQTCNNSDQPILIAWMNSWERDQITDQLDHGWAGSMTLPRHMYLKDNKIFQAFPETLLKKLVHYQASYLGLQKNKSRKLSCTNSCFIEFEVYIKKGVLKLCLLNSDNHHLELQLDGNQSRAILDRSNAKYFIHSKMNEDENIRQMPIEKRLKCQILLDKSSIEVIINGLSMTSLFYGDEDCGSCYLIADNDLILHNVKIYNF